MRELELALKDYINNGNPITLDSLLVAPNVILDSSILPEDHQLNYEAETILDSLNSYNQGLNNDLETELLNIPVSSPFYSWRCLTLAFKELYKQNTQEMTKHLNEIREGSAIKPIIKQMYPTDGSTLYTYNNELNSSIDALKDVIDNTLTDMYQQTFKLVIQDLQGFKKDTLNNILLTIIEDSLKNIPLETIQTSINLAVGLKETFRLMGIGTIYTHPIQSIQYWFCYIIEINSNSVISTEMQVALNIILDIVKALIKEKYKFSDKEEKKIFTNSSNLFIEELKKLTNIEDAESTNPLTKLKKALVFKTNNSIKKEVISTYNIQGELF